MNVEIGSLKDLRTKGKSTHFVFNVKFTHEDAGESYLLAALRIINNKIYGPSVKIGNKYLTVLYVGKKVAEYIYEALWNLLPPDYELADFKSATARLCINAEAERLMMPDSDEETEN